MKITRKIGLSPKSELLLEAMFRELGLSFDETIERALELYVTAINERLANRYLKSHDNNHKMASERIEFR